MKVYANQKESMDAIELKRLENDLRGLNITMQDYMEAVESGNVDEMLKERGKMEMRKIVVFENGSKMKLIAVVVEKNGDEHELTRTDRGRDDLLNKIDEMNLSYLPVEFK